MICRLLVDAVIVLHLAFVLFAAFGAFAALRWRRLLWLHVPALAWGAWIELTDGVCPLTPLEDLLRRAGGLPPYGGDFIDRYITSIVYPASLRIGEHESVRLLVCLAPVSRDRAGRAGHAGLFWSVGHPRIRGIGNPGSVCSRDPYRQFTLTAFEGALPGSVGLESGNSYLQGCFVNVVDLAVARNFHIGGSKSIQFRLDMFNAGNRSTVTGRATTINFNSISDPVTIANSPFASNHLERLTPRSAGPGVATNFQPPRSLQLQLRLSF